MAGSRMSGTVPPQAPPAPGASARTGKPLSEPPQRAPGATAGAGRGGSSSQRNGPRGLRLHSAPPLHHPRESLHGPPRSNSQRRPGWVPESLQRRLPVGETKFSAQRPRRPPRRPFPIPQDLLITSLPLLTLSGWRWLPTRGAGRAKCGAPGDFPL